MIANGATVGGNGSIGGSLTTQAAASTIAPGNSPGTLAVGTLDPSFLKNIHVVRISG